MIQEPFEQAKRKILPPVIIVHNTDVNKIINRFLNLGDALDSNPLPDQAKPESYARNIAVVHYALRALTKIDEYLVSKDEKRDKIAFQVEGNEEDLVYSDTALLGVEKLIPDALNNHEYEPIFGLVASNQNAVQAMSLSHFTDIYMNVLEVEERTKGVSISDIGSAEDIDALRHKALSSLHDARLALKRMGAESEAKDIKSVVESYTEVLSSQQQQYRDMAPVARKIEQYFKPSSQNSDGPYMIVKDRINGMGIPLIEPPAVGGMHVRNNVPLDQIINIVRRGQTP